MRKTSHPLLDHLLSIKTETRIHLRRHESRNDVQNGLSEQNAQLVQENGHHLLLVLLLMLLTVREREHDYLGILHSSINDVRILRLLSGLQATCQQAARNYTPN